MKLHGTGRQQPGQPRVFRHQALTTKDGRYTNAIYGFQNILLNLLAAHKPDAVAIAWDLRAPTFRHKAYDGYKATRHGMPEELAQQMPVLKELLTDLGFVQVSREGWEADDILGTLAAACEAAGGTTLLATGDRDSLQLVDDATPPFCWPPTKRPFPWTPPPSAKSMVSSRRSSSTSRA